MTQDFPLISFCILSYQSCDLLRNCLKSILENPVHHPYEIIIVDNNSSDGTVEMLQSEFPEVRLIKNLVEGGYTAPMNQALRIARGNGYLVQLNSDTLTLPGTFDCLVEFMEEHPQVGICIPKVLNRDGTFQKQCRRSEARPWDVLAYFLGLSRFFPKNKLFSGYLMGHYGEDEIHPVEAVSGSCMFIRRKVIDQIGYLDEQFYAYQEDTDFCFRARKAGWKVYYAPIAKIIHFGGQGGSQVHLTRSIVEWHRSYYLYYRKNLARDYFFLVNWLYYGLMLVKLALALFSAWIGRRSYVGTPKP